MNKLAPYAKALIGALVGGLGSLYQALDNGSVTGQEWVAVAMTTLVGLAAVFAIPNRDPEARHQADSVQPPDAGIVVTELCLVVIAAGVVVYVLFGANLAR